MSRVLRHPAWRIALVCLGAVVIALIIATDLLAPWYASGPVGVLLVVLLVSTIRAERRDVPQPEPTGGPDPDDPDTWPIKLELSWYSCHASGLDHSWSATRDMPEFDCETELRLRRTGKIPQRILDQGRCRTRDEAIEALVDFTERHQWELDRRLMAQRITAGRNPDGGWPISYRSTRIATWTPRHDGSTT